MVSVGLFKYDPCVIGVFLSVVDFLMVEKQNLDGNILRRRRAISPTF